MKDTLEIVGMAAGCAAIVGVLGLLVLRLLRGRSLRAALFAIALSSVLAMAAGTVAVAHAMFISPDDFGAVIVVLVSAGIVALVMAGLLGRSVAADSKALRSALRSLGAGPANGARRPAAAGPPPKLATSEMADLSRELAATTMRLAEPPERERAPERSPRDLVPSLSPGL